MIEIYEEGDVIRTVHRLEDIDLAIYVYSIFIGYELEGNPFEDMRIFNDMNNSRDLEIMNHCNLLCVPISVSLNELTELEIETEIERVLNRSIEHIHTMKYTNGIVCARVENYQSYISKLLSEAVNKISYHICNKEKLLDTLKKAYLKKADNIRV